MKMKANTVDEYLEAIQEGHKDAAYKLRDVIRQNIPVGFEETLSYGMLGYVVPHRLYPAGYHCTPQLPLPFISVASQKNFVAFYHMGIYADAELLKWFMDVYHATHSKKIDMGKSCMRFKKKEDIPFEAIGQLVAKISVESWIATYEAVFKK
jgi:uncharacterized protein YdhG (YjbR/CyaY superfamily)